MDFVTGGKKRPYVSIQAGSTTSDDSIVFRILDKAGVVIFNVLQNGQIQASNMPTSSAGLASGTLWNDAGVVKIV